MVFQIRKSLKWLVLLELAVPMVLLILGIYHGLLQVLYRSGMVSQASFAALDYYQGLTLHGVINALVLTTFFAVAFGHCIMAYYLKRDINTRTGWISFALMMIGTLMAAWAMLSGQASVLYTFYPPLKAHPLFYIGATLLVVGSWVAIYGWVLEYRAWKRDNPDTKLPLAVLGNLANSLIWFVCTLPLAVEVIGLLIPWSLGITETVNIPLSRTLFWFFGHALVYFWLLPAYIMFYTMLPALAGGKLYSDNAGRLVFFLFIILSIPVGVHHQFGEPSITKGVKMFQSLLTFGVAVPSFITAFTIAASLEYAGVKRGARGLFGWLAKLPYFDRNNYLFPYLMMGLLTFIFGGFTGMVNASYNLNSMVHNTAWLPGHFHLTVAGPVFLAILGMSLHLTSSVTGKPVRFKTFATMVPYLWTFGVLIFSTGLMWGGLLGEPRRTNMGMSYLNPDSPLYEPDWVITSALGVFGGVMMFVAGAMYFLVYFTTLFGAKSEEPGIQFPRDDSIHDEPRLSLLSSFRPWIIIMIILILLAYVPAIMNVLEYAGPQAPGFSPADPTPQIQ